jgi:hypothetical protein
MEEYINWGLHHMEDKLIDNPNHYYKPTAFLEEFLSIDLEEDSIEEEPASLDDSDESTSQSITEEVPQPKQRRARIGQKIEPIGRRVDDSELPDDL